MTDDPKLKALEAAEESKGFDLLHFVRQHVVAQTHESWRDVMMSQDDYRNAARATERYRQSVRDEAIVRGIGSEQKFGCCEMTCDEVIHAIRAAREAE